ncbi:MAG: hypothetical protein ABII27_03745, partial [bacterium]
LRVASPAGFHAMQSASLDTAVKASPIATALAPMPIFKNSADLVPPLSQKADVKVMANIRKAIQDI